MQIKRPNEFDVSEAMERLRALVTYWQDKYGIEPDWKDDGASVSGNIMGFSFEAHLTVDDAEILVKGPPPNILVRGRVIGYIEEKLDEYLDPEVSVDDLA